MGTRSRVERALPLSTVITWLGTRYLRSTRRLLTWIDSTLSSRKNVPAESREGNRAAQGNRQTFFLHEDGELCIAMLSGSNRFSCEPSNTRIAPIDLLFESKFEQIRERFSKRVNARALQTKLHRTFTWSFLETRGSRFPPLFNFFPRGLMEIEAFFAVWVDEATTLPECNDYVTGDTALGVDDF